jgi:predicted nucleic acid-binding protein
VKQLPRVYIDSCIVIELAKFAKRLHKPERENDLWFVRQMLKATEEGEIEVVSSAITVAESLFLGFDDKKMPIECDLPTQEFLINLLTSGRLVKLIEPGIFVAESARDLRWKHGLKLKPYDSMHVASALVGQCKELLSWDTDMSSQKRAEEIRVLSSLGLRVIAPHDSNVLPETYRQQGLALAAPNKQKMLPPPSVQ